MTETAVGDRRRKPYCWQGLSDLQALRENCPEKNLSSTLAVYQALTEGAALHYRTGGRDGFVDSRRTLAQAAGVSVRTFDAATERLSGIGLLEVEKRREGDTDLPNRYCLTPHATVSPVQPLREPHATSSATLHTSRAHETIEVDIDKKKTASSSMSEVASDPDAQTTAEIIERPEIGSLCVLLADQVAAKGVKRPDPTQKRWRDAARLMIDRDGLDPKHIEWIIRWVHSPGQFWGRNVLSMPTLREKWARVWLAAKAEHEKRNGADTRIAEFEVLKQEARQREQTQQEMRR